jgi:hypothetical protein
VTATVCGDLHQQSQLPTRPRSAGAPPTPPPWPCLGGRSAEGTAAVPRAHGCPPRPPPRADTGEDDMFAVVCRCRSPSEVERQFILEWPDLTRAMRRACGSYGSRLHRGPDGNWIARARWSDPAARVRRRHGQDDGVRRLRDDGHLLGDEWTGEIESDLSSEGPPRLAQDCAPVQAALDAPMSRTRSTFVRLLAVLGLVTNSLLFVLVAAAASGIVTSSPIGSPDDPAPSPEAPAGRPHPEKRPPGGGAGGAHRRRSRIAAAHCNHLGPPGASTEVRGKHRAEGAVRVRRGRTARKRDSQQREHQSCSEAGSGCRTRCPSDPELVHLGTASGLSATSTACRCRLRRR